MFGIMSKEDKVKAALVQMAVASERPEKNLERAEQAVKEAAGAGCRLVVLPELWATGYNLKRRERWASPLGKGMFAESARLAKEYRIFLQAGSLLSVRRGQYYNTATLYDPKGRSLGHYDKMHLFRFMGEPKYLSPGQKASTYTLPWGPAGQSICYDLRFPELYRIYGRRLCSVIFVPSEWPLPRREHWRTLLRARAIENQCFVLGVNRVGRYQDIRFFGSSAAIAPDGTTLVEGKSRENLLFAELDFSQVEQLRSTFPVLRDMR